VERGFDDGAPTGLLVEGAFIVSFKGVVVSGIVSLQTELQMGFLFKELEPSKWAPKGLPVQGL
jgi:hypothetical protein